MDEFLEQESYSPPQEVVSIISSTLGIKRGPSLPLAEWYNRIVYAATAEWLRILPLSYDPIIGNRDAVSMSFITANGISILQELALSIFGRTPDYAFAERNIKWMLNSMLRIHELWQPDGREDVIAAASTSCGEPTGDRLRIYGPMPCAPREVMASGLGLFTRDGIGEAEAAERVKQKQQTEWALARIIAGRRPARTANEIAADLQVRADDSGCVSCNLSEAADDEAEFILAHAWPTRNGGEEVMYLYDWSFTQNWALPSWLPELSSEKEAERLNYADFQQQKQAG